MADMTGTDADADAGAANDAAGSSEAARNNQIRPEETVYDASGARLGSVEHAELDKGYFEAKTGGLLGRTLYIPLDAVARVGDGGIHLKVAKGDLDKLDWYLPPTNGVDLDTPYSPSPWIETGYGQGRRAVPPGDRARMLERDEQAGMQPPPPPDLASGERAREHTDTLPSALAPDASGPGGDDARGETTIAVPLAEERLEARTHSEADTAQVRKVVSSEPRSVELPVTHDELRVERVPVTDEAAAHALGPDAFTEKDIDVPLMGEQVTLQKRTRVTEEVVLRKQRVTQQQTFTGEVRKERVWVEGTDGREIAPGNGGTRTRSAGTDTGKRERERERDISDEDTMTYDRFAAGHEGPEAYRQ